MSFGIIGGGVWSVYPVPLQTVPVTSMWKSGGRKRGRRNLSSSTSCWRVMRGIVRLAFLTFLHRTAYLWSSGRLRSVHAWDYRRYILRSCPASVQRSEADELKYTEHKIESNFSNFS